MPDDHPDHAELVGVVGPGGDEPCNDATSGPDPLTWDQGRQAWVPPGGLLPPARAPEQSWVSGPVVPRSRRRAGRGMIILAAVVILIVVAAAAAIGGFRHIKAQDSAVPFEVPSASNAPPTPLATPPPTGATTSAPPSTPAAPPSPSPSGSTSSQHEIHYLAGATSSEADIVIRRSNGQLDEQRGLAMPLQSKLGANYLTVHLATGAEAVIRVVAPTASAGVWCSITVDGLTRVSTVQANDHHISTCSVKITDGVDYDTNA